MREYITRHKYTVYQLNIRHLSDFIKEHGWARAAQLRKEVEAHLATTTHGSKEWKPEYQDYYNVVCEIRAANLDGVWEVGNIGPEYLLNRFAPMHSISVGDLILDPTGRFFMVEDEGFTKVEVHKEAA